MEEMDADRLARMSENARRLHTAGHLRRGISVDDADRRALDLQPRPSSTSSWSSGEAGRPQRFGRFIADAMIDALL